VSQRSEPWPENVIGGRQPRQELEQNPEPRSGAFRPRGDPNRTHRDVDIPPQRAEPWIDQVSLPGLALFGDSNDAADGPRHLEPPTRSRQGNVSAKWSKRQVPINADSRITRNVFVIHGRDDEARRYIFDLLRRLSLWPMEWESIVRATGMAAPTLLDVIERGLDLAQAVVVLLTPDDIVRLHPDLWESNERAFERNLSLQARPNVYIELGMALATHRHRTIIVEFGDSRPTADIASLNVLRFDGSLHPVSKLIQRLKDAGCPVDDSGTDWLELDRLGQLAAYGRRPKKQRSQTRAETP